MHICSEMMRKMARNAESWKRNYLFTIEADNSDAFPWSQGRVVLMISGTVGVLLGIAFAASAGKFPAQKATLERWGGMLLVSGIALIAFAFPFV